MFREPACDRLLMCMCVRASSSNQIAIGWQYDVVDVQVERNLAHLNQISFRMKKKNNNNKQIARNFYRYKCLRIFCLWCYLAHFIHKHCESSVTNEQTIKQTVRQKERNVHFSVLSKIEQIILDILNYINSEKLRLQIALVAIETFDFFFAC